MGWVWKDDDIDIDNDAPRRFNASPSSDMSSTRRFVRSQCKTEEVEPGKFIRKCEKTEQLLKDCVGRPGEVVQSNKEYTEEDVTDEVLKGGGSVMFGSSGHAVFDLPGLRSDIEAMERNLFGSLGRILGAAEEMKNGFFDIFVKSPSIFDAESSSSPSIRQGIPVEEYHQQEVHPKPKEQGSTDTDFAAMAREV